MHELLIVQATPHQPVEVCAKPSAPKSCTLRVERHEHMTPVVGCIGADSTPYECFGQPGIPRDSRALRIVEVIPRESKIPEVDEGSDTHQQ